MKIEIENGELTISGDTDTINAMLKPHGLHIAPLPAPEPPPQTEAERLVELARSLPEDAWVGTEYGEPQFHTNEYCWCSVIETDVGETYLCTKSQFRTILLGVMAAYCGTEKGAGVGRNSDGTYGWWTKYDSGVDPCDLTAYAACCKAIAERRKGGA